MNKLEAIQHHQTLIAKRKQLVNRQNISPAINSIQYIELIVEIDKEIGHYGNVHNPKIATKAAQYIGL